MTRNQPVSISASGSRRHGRPSILKFGNSWDLISSIYGIFSQNAGNREAWLHLILLRQAPWNREIRVKFGEIRDISEYLRSLHARTGMSAECQQNINKMSNVISSECQTECHPAPQMSRRISHGHRNLCAKCLHLCTFGCRMATGMAQKSIIQ